MSGANYITTCPKCEQETLVAYTDWKPHDIVSGICLNCGFYYTTKEGKLTKEELAEQQKEYGYNLKTKKFE